MPFQSEKQRRYLHANHPEIANRWEAKYGLGGIADLNDLPEYYIPKNQGGFIPSHEAGIYGLAEGGRTDYIHGGITYPSGRRGFPGGAGTPGGYDGGSGSKSGTTGESRGPSHLSHNAPPETKTTPTLDPDRGWQTYAIEDPITRDEDIKKGPQEDWTEDDVKKAIKEGERKKELRELALRGEKTEDWEKKQEWNKPNKFLSFLGNAALTIIPGLLPAKLATTFRVGKLGYELAYTDKWDSRIKALGFNKNEILSKVKGIGDSKLDLYESFADTPNHPERIALQAELEIGKKTPTDVPERDGATQETNIKIENIEEVNDAKTQLLRKYQEMNEASRLAWLRQQEMEAKRQAYLRNFRQMYMSAQGGRVPAGYNTGGLSNLFRLKNR